MSRYGEMYDELNSAMKVLTEESSRVYGNQSFANGYFQGMLLALLIPRNEELFTTAMRQLNSAIAQLKEKDAAVL